MRGVQDKRLGGEREGDRMNAQLDCAENYKRSAQVRIFVYHGPKEGQILAVDLEYRSVVLRWDDATWGHLGRDGSEWSRAEQTRAE